MTQQSMCNTRLTQLQTDNRPTQSYRYHKVTLKMTTEYERSHTWFLSPVDATISKATRLQMCAVNLQSFLVAPQLPFSYNQARKH